MNLGNFESAVVKQKGARGSNFDAKFCERAWVCVFFFFF